jgi:hypothetical protein
MMTFIRVAVVSVATAALPLPGEAFAYWGQSLQSFGGINELSSVIAAACGANYVRTHHQGSSNYVCVHRATVLPGGPKLTVEPKQPLNPAGSSSGQVKTK